MASTDLEKVGPGYFPPIKYRNMWVQLLLMIATIGFYAVYWFYSTATDMANRVKREEPTVLWTILTFVPIISFYPCYKYSELFEEVSPEHSRWLIFLLWLIFPPAVWVIVQLKLNRLALSASS